MWDWWEEHSAALRMQARCGLRELARKSDSKFAQKKNKWYNCRGFLATPTRIGLPPWQPRRERRVDFALMCCKIPGKFFVTLF